MEGRDWDDWRVLDSLFDDWARRWGPFDVDGCCDVYRANRHVEVFWSDFLSQDCRGKNVYANLPFSNIEKLLVHFLTAKKDQPMGIAALFVVPMWANYGFWQKLVLGLVDEDRQPVLQIAQRFPKGEEMFTSPHGAQGQRKFCGPTRWPVALLRVSPKPLLGVNWELLDA